MAQVKRLAYPNGLGEACSERFRTWHDAVNRLLVTVHGIPDGCEAWCMLSATFFLYYDRGMSPSKAAARAVAVYGVHS